MQTRWAPDSESEPDSWYEDNGRSYLVSGTKKKAMISWTPPSTPPRPYHHSGVIASAMGLANSTQTVVRVTWTVCWIMRPWPRSCRKNISWIRSA